MKIFIDTSAFIALFVTKDIDYKKIIKKYQEYKQQRALLFTSYYVLDELFTRLLYDFGKHIAEVKVEELLEAIRKQEFHVFFVDEAIFQKATKIFIKLPNIVFLSQMQHHMFYVRNLK